MDSEEENRLLYYQQVMSHEGAGFDHDQEGKDQEASDEEEKMSEKQSSSYSKLRQGKFKMKIKEASVSAQGQCSGSTPVRVCDFCGKKFNSGKALGGHRRHHVQARRKMKEQEEKVSYTLRTKSKNSVIRDDDDDNNLIKSKNGNLNSSSLRSFRCLVCDKDFPSEKSLCGHMKSHPDREWRGMNPPFVATDNALASSSSSEELMTVQDNRSSSSTSEESLSVPANLSSSCSESNRHEKDRRGRKSMGEAEAAHIAAQTLMDMHLYGKSLLRDRLPPHDEPTSEAAALLPVTKRKMNVMKNHVAGSCSSPAGKQNEKLEGRDGNEELEADMKVISLIKEKKKMNKKMKLGPEMINSEEGEPLMIRTVEQEEVKPSQSYVCDVCNKSFTCFQALGGHKTKHRKNIVKSMKGKEVVEQRQEGEKVEEDKICFNGALSGEEAAALITSEERLVISSNDNENNSNDEEVGEARQQSASKIRGFDLNVPYVLEDDEATDL